VTHGDYAHVQFTVSSEVKYSLCLNASLHVNCHIHIRAPQVCAGTLQKGTKARRLLTNIYCLIFWKYFKWKELRSTGEAAVNVKNLPLCSTKCFARVPLLVSNINHRYSYLCWRKYRVSRW